MDDDYDEPTDAGDDLFEMDGPGLFDEVAPADAPPDVAPVVTREPDDGLSDEDEDEFILGGAEDLAADSVSLDTVAPELAAPASRHQPRPTDNAPAAPLALYRRYRPETFSEVIGQEHVTDPLQRALTNNKVNHAYLFSGPRGCGKTTSARILARCLNCEQGPTPNPCGQCQSCRDLARGGSGSIDVIEIDAASHGGVDDARDLRERAFFAPVHSRYKIYIIDEAHMVTAQGFNAMLKLVEEPPPHVKFIFATTEPEKVIGTIRSRTHHYPFRLVPPKVLQNYLATLCEAEGVSVDQTVLPLVVRAGAGSVRDSLSVLDQLLGGAAEGGVSYQQASALLGYTPDALLDEIMDAFAAGDSAGVFATIDKVIEVGQDPRRFAEDLLRRLRDLVIVAAVPDAVSSGLIDVSGDQAERLETQANGMGAGELTRAAEVIATGLTDMRGTTAPRLHLELMCSRVLLPGADVDGRGIHARLDRLERRIGMPGAPAPAQRPAAAPARQEPAAEHEAGPQHVEPHGQGDAPAPAEQRPTPQQQPQQQAPEQQAPAGQRPAPATAPGQGQRPAPGQGQRPAGGPLGQRPAERPTAQAAAPEPSDGQAAPPRVASGNISAADVRRLWPQVLEEVKSRRRFAWILLSQNAQVMDVRDGVLTLGFSNSGARDRFASGGSQDVLRDCMVQVMGADLRVEAIIDGNHGGSAGRGPQPPQPPQPSAPASSGQAPAAPQGGQGDWQASTPAAPAREEAPAPVPGNQNSDDPGPRTPPSAPEPPEPPADTSRWTEQARQNIRPTSSGPSAPEVEVDESQLVSDDDESLDESGESAHELITRALGGVVIAEEQPAV